eukprot:2766933-Amphidinium_carterae.1
MEILLVVIFVSTVCGRIKSANEEGNRKRKDVLATKPLRRVWWLGSRSWPMLTLLVTSLANAYLFGEN